MEESALEIYATLLVTLVVVISVPALAIYRESTRLTIRRWPFVLWVALYVIVLPTVFNVATALLPGLATDAVLVIAAGCFVYVFYQRLVRRARDAGKGKRIAYIGVVPLANLVVFVILMLARSAAPGDSAQAAAV